MKRLFAKLEFLAFYIKEVLLSNLSVARDVLSPRPRISPGIVEIRCGELDEMQGFWLANLITMTPGTLTVDISLENRVVKIHSLYADQKEEIEEMVREGYERRIRNAF